MYKCDRCKAEFSEPKEHTEWSHSNYIGFGGWYPETENVCPECGSTDVYEVEECEACHEYAWVEEVEMVGEITLCPDCYNKVAAILNEAVKQIVEQTELSTDDAQHLLSNFYC